MHQSINFRVFTFLFILFSFGLFSSPAKASDVSGVDVYTFSGATVDYQFGTLYSKEGFVPFGHESHWECCIGSVSLEDQSAINGKPVTRLSLWISLSKYYPKFSRSQATYSIDGVPYVIVSMKGHSAPATPDTKPQLNAIALELDAEVNQPMTIPLSVVDEENDAFDIIGGPKGRTYSAQPYDLNGLQTKDFQWTPTAAQANKVFTVKFKAKESVHKKLTSNTVITKIRVWPAGGQTDAASVSKFSVSAAKWDAGVLTLTGKVVLNKIMTADERAAFLTKTLDLSVTAGITGTGLPVGSPLPLTLSDTGNWSVTMLLPAAEVPCKITLKYEDRLAARTIGRAPQDCLK